MPSSPEIAPGHIGLSVTDLDRSLEFYQDVLGLELDPARRRDRPPVRLPRRRRPAVPHALAAEQRRLRAQPGRPAPSRVSGSDARRRPGRGGQAPRARSDAPLRRRRAAPGGRRLGGSVLRRSRRDQARDLQPDRGGRVGGARGRRAVLRLLLMGQYHEGELEVQRRAGVVTNAERIGRSIHGTIPDAAREFVAEREFLLLGAADAAGRVWAALLQGAPGFVSVPARTGFTWRRARGPKTPRGDAGGPGGRGHAADRSRYTAPHAPQRPGTAGRSRRDRDRRPGGLRELSQVHPPSSRAAPGRLHGGEDGADRSAHSEQVAWLSRVDTIFLATRHPDAGADVSHRGGPPASSRCPTPVACSSRTTRAT